MCGALLAPVLRPLITILIRATTSSFTDTHQATTRARPLSRSVADCTNIDHFVDIFAETKLASSSKNCTHVELRLQRRADCTEIDRTATPKKLATTKPNETTYATQSALPDC